MSTTTNVVDISKLSPLVDGDVLVYNCGFAADSQLKKQIKESEPDVSPEKLAEMMEETDYLSYALHNTKQVMQDVLGKFSDNYKLFLTGSGNFREQVATILPYKGNRDPTHKPKYYREVKDYLTGVWHAETIHGREADDAMGCAQWAAKDKSTVIVTIDKDLNQIPGHHYNWRKDEFYDVSLAEANQFFWYQMLDGDRTDNIPGIRGLGEKRIPKLFQGLTELSDFRIIVQEQYKKQYGEDWEKAYIEVAELLWMERVEGKKCPFLF